MSKVIFNGVCYVLRIRVNMRRNVRKLVYKRMNDSVLAQGCPSNLDFKNILRNTVYCNSNCNSLFYFIDCFSLRKH